MKTPNSRERADVGVMQSDTTLHTEGSVFKQIRMRICGGGLAHTHVSRVCVDVRAQLLGGSADAFYVVDPQEGCDDGKDVRSREDVWKCHRRGGMVLSVPFIQLYK